MDENALLYRNYMILKRVYDKNNTFKVKRPIFPLIYFIYKNDNYVKISDIVNEFHFSKGRITQIINTLIEDGLLIKKLENNSRKQAFISLSSKGLEYYKKTEPIMQKKAQNIAEYMGEKDLKELNRLIEKLLSYEEEDIDENNN